MARVEVFKSWAHVNYFGYHYDKSLFFLGASINYIPKYQNHKVDTWHLYWLIFSPQITLALQLSRMPDYQSCTLQTLNEKQILFATVACWRFSFLYCKDDILKKSANRNSKGNDDIEIFYSVLLILAFVEKHVLKSKLVYKIYFLKLSVRVIKSL